MDSLGHASPAARLISHHCKLVKMLKKKQTKEMHTSHPNKTHHHQKQKKPTQLMSKYNSKNTFWCVIFLQLWKQTLPVVDQINMFLTLNLYLELVWPQEIWYTTRHPTTKDMNHSCDVQVPAEFKGSQRITTSSFTKMDGSLQGFRWRRALCDKPWTGHFLRNQQFTLRMSKPRQSLRNSAMNMKLAYESSKHRAGVKLLNSATDRFELREMPFYLGDHSKLCHIFD